MCGNTQPRERKHRLTRDCYRGPVRVTFTMCIRDHRPAFTTQDAFLASAARLQQGAARNACRVVATCFMPDHLHLTLEGLEEGADAWAAAVYFKQLSGLWFAQNRPDTRWQKDFYDHILRGDEDLVRHVTYILENPVRRGLVEDWRQYPYSYAHADLGLGKDPPLTTAAD